MSYPFDEEPQKLGYKAVWAFIGLAILLFVSSGAATHPTVITVLIGAGILCIIIAAYITNNDYQIDRKQPKMEKFIEKVKPKNNIQERMLELKAKYGRGE